VKQLIKILLEDEKIVAQLTVRYNELKSNIANESLEDKVARLKLGMNIASMKKVNAKIVNHCLDERKLSEMEIEQITNEHGAEVQK
jgi:hypothetical protein